MNEKTESPLKPEHITPERMWWVPSAQLINDLPLTCIDGRQEGSYFSAAGGDMGIFMALAAAAEKISGQDFPEPALTGLLKSCMAGRKAFYLHSDDHALHALAAKLREQGLIGEEQENGAAMEKLLRLPPEALREPLLELLGQPGNNGCGHLAGMLNNPEGYGIRGRLVADALRAFFKIRWADEANTDFRVLHGDHKEQAVLVIEGHPEPGGGGKVPGYTVHSDAPNMFVLHKFAESYLMQRSAAGFGGDAGMFLPNPIPPGVLIDEAATLAEKQLGVTVKKLASHLPLHKAEFGEGKIKLME